jgi:RHS repeat-associated protein
VSSGWTIFNNKGKPVRQYEPFFSQLPEKRHQYEFGVQVGVSPILFYDPVERVVATLHPNHTYEKVVFDAWQQTTYDVNDTVTFVPSSDADVMGFFVKPDGTPRIPTTDYLPTWHAQRIGEPASNPERDAAEKAAAHANTPTVAHFDTLGRPFLTLAHNGFKLDGTPIQFRTRVKLDIEGNQREVRDAIEQSGDTQGRIVMRYDYDMLGNRIHQASMEAGARWMLNDVAGKPIRAWDSRDHASRTQYDPLRRPLRSFSTGADPTNPNQEFLTERLVYGEQHPEGELRNLRGRLYLHLDQAGVVISEAHDFKGNPLRASRRLTNGTQYRHAVDWISVDADHVALPADARTLLHPVALETALAPGLEAETYTSRTTYDALNRPVELTTPHTPAMQPNVIRPGYNEANLLERVEANLRGATAAGQPVWTPFVSNIDYDAKGQRTLIDYGNGARTTYEHDPLTFRLVHMLTRRDATIFSGDCPRPPPDGWPGCQVQNLQYTYDPVGNITHIRDDAQQIVYFRNQRVEPGNDYTYDPLYRLIEATGREHLGQTSARPNSPPAAGPNPPTAPDAFNDFHTRLNHPSDGNAMGTYIERYVYDAVGNFLEMQHRGSDPVHPGWTRSYVYGEASLIEDGTGSVPRKTSNRLSSTTVGSNSPPVERYVYDAHGNMIRMPHLGGAHPAPNMHWDYRDQPSQVDLGGGGTAYYVYDAAGQRVRKVWEKPANLIEERIYFGGFEIYRRRQGAERFERETLHIMDDKQRIALVETRTLDTASSDHAPAQLIRYQFGNHLGSASLELDHQAQIISYEEYTPYGSTSYQAVRSQTETPKRYRYTGMERDGESGLSYHSARYYAPWLGRWSSPDPAGMVDGTNSYGYVHGIPLRLVDPSGSQSVAARSQDIDGYVVTDIVRGEEVVGYDFRFAPAVAEPAANLLPNEPSANPPAVDATGEPAPNPGPNEPVDNPPAGGATVLMAGDLIRIGEVRRTYQQGAAAQRRGLLQQLGRPGVTREVEEALAARAVANRRALLRVARARLEGTLGGSVNRAAELRDLSRYGDPLGARNPQHLREVAGQDASLRAIARGLSSAEAESAASAAIEARTPRSIMSSSGRPNFRASLSPGAGIALGVASLILLVVQLARGPQVEWAEIDLPGLDPSNFPVNSVLYDGIPDNLHRVIVGVGRSTPWFGLGTRRNVFVYTSMSIEGMTF